MSAHKDKFGGKTPFTMKYLRPLDVNRMFLRTFGSYCQYMYFGEGEKPPHKMDERTRDGCFVGLEFPSALVLDSNNKIRRISIKKLRCHEKAYCLEPCSSIAELKATISKSFGDNPPDFEVDIPVTLQSIQSLRQAKDLVHETEYLRACMGRSMCRSMCKSIFSEM